MITLIKALRADENTVNVMYFHPGRKQKFVVEWSNINPETGGAENYDLQITCLSESEHLNELVKDAIREGSEDSELYIALRDTFDRLDCESVE